MTKEEIWKGIAKLIEDRFKQPAEKAGLTWDKNFNYMLASDILSYLHSQEVVIKVGKPFRTSESVNGDGLVAVEPLI